MEEIRVWINNEEEVEKAVLDGEETEALTTEYGANEFAVDFLKECGIWDKLLLKPKRGKENGIDYKKLGGIAILLELLHVGQISKAGKIIKDAKLMRELGFTFEKIKESKDADKGVIHKDTIRNYFKAIPINNSIKSFYDFTGYMRENRWIRGKVYAADGFKIEVEGKTYEGIGKVSDGKEDKYGYKVVILMNIEDKRERITGFAIAPINTDERKMLLGIFKDLEKHVGRIKDIIDTIVIDRGYWGYDFLEKILVKKYHIDYVVIAKKSFMFVKEDLRHLIDSKQIKFEDRRLFNKTRRIYEEVEAGYIEGLLHGYVNKKQPYQGTVNVVVLKKKAGDMGKEKDKEIFYVTNKKIKRDPLKIVEMYANRWSIENKGIRELSQKWLIRIKPGRTLNAITARISLILMLYNAMKIMEMKYGKEWKKNKEEIESRGEKGLIGGQGIIIYWDKYYGTFTVREYKELIKKATKIEVEKKILENLEEHLPRDKIEELKQKLFS